MALTKRSLLKLALAAWQLAHVCEMRGYLKAEVERLKKLVLKGEEVSIWKMRKQELVETAVRLLGWSRSYAEKETVGQLRLYLKEENDRQKTAGLIPKGLTKMKLEDLQVEAMNRGLPTEDEKDRRKTREELIRDIKSWAAEDPAHEGEEAEQPKDKSPSSSSLGATGKAKAARTRPDALAYRPTTRGSRQREAEPGEAEDFQMLDPPPARLHARR